MKTTTHKTLLEAIATVVNNFGVVRQEKMGQDGEFTWSSDTHAGSVYFNHDSDFNKVWHVKASKI